MLPKVLTSLFNGGSARCTPPTRAQCSPGVSLGEVLIPGLHLCRRASAELCDSFLEALAALVRAAALAAAQGALPPLRHLPELLGILVAAAPDTSRTAWRSKLSRVSEQVVSPKTVCSPMCHGLRQSSAGSGHGSVACRQIVNMLYHKRGPVCCCIFLNSDATKLH